jgi:hypothetical protein
MKVVVIAVAGLAFWLIGSRIVDRGQDLSAVARSTENRVTSVTRVLEQATANVQGDVPADQKEWTEKANRVCARQSRALSRLERPVSLDQIAGYVGRALPVVRRHHALLSASPPPDALAGPVLRASRAFEKQEHELRRIRAAARRGDSAGTLERVDNLRSLARAANPNLIRLGLVNCTLPAWGIPL